MTRAVLRRVEPAIGGGESYCAGCDSRISFSARHKRFKVIANVYVGKRWDRTEQFHAECYDGRHGEAA